MTIIFTELSITNDPKFSNIKPSGFMFEERDCTIKVISSPNCYKSGDGVVENAAEIITGAINEAPPEDRRRLLLELELLMKHFRHNSKITEFLESILMKLGDRDDCES